MDQQILGDRYELMEPIGRGGMATIYRARDTKMGRLVAVKILREMYSNDKKFVLRFQREASSVSSLAHPNIVQVYDYGRSDDLYFIVMELIEGVDLRKYLRANGVLDTRRAVVIGHDVALALGAAHRRGIVHRDVKPQNILVNDEGLVKLTDFGIATFYRESNERLTTTGMTLGTVQYYAPEQAQGENVSPAADVYSLGIVLYEMLVGRPPFDGDTPVAIAVRHIQEAPIRPSRYNPSIPLSLERVILRCLEKDPADRYPDGDALAYALETYEKQQRNSGKISTPMGAAKADPNSFSRSSAGIQQPRSRPLSQPNYQGRQNNTGRNSSPFADSSFPGGRDEFNSTIEIFPDSTSPRSSLKRPDDDEDENTSPVAGLTTVFIIAAVMLVLALSVFLSFQFKIFSLGGTATATPTIKTVVMPNLVGDSLQQAETAASAAGLTQTLVISYKTNDTTDKPNTVISQSTQANTSIPADTSITITVSQPPNTVNVPDVTGYTASQAQTTIQQAGLQYVLGGYVYSVDISVGDVVYTTPGKGTSVNPNTVIKVYLSNGPQATATPAATATPSVTATPSATATPSVTPTPTGSPAPTPTSTPPSSPTPSTTP